MLSAKSGEIAREQLVTPALEQLVDSIPAANIISVTSTNGFVGGVNLDKLTPEQIEQMVAKIKQIQDDRQSAKENTVVGV
jgi:hypothetical protein